MKATKHTSKTPQLEYGQSPGVVIRRVQQPELTKLRASSFAKMSFQHR